MNDPFLAAIAAAPADDGPRLILADALDESEDEPDRARAEFIRLQCALARMDDDHPRRAALRSRERELFELYSAMWAGDLSGIVESLEFRRGLLDGIVIVGHRLMTHKVELFRRGLLRRLRLTDAVAICGEMAQCRELRQVRELDLCGNDLDDFDAEVLIRSPHLAGLQRLDLSFNRLTDRVPQMLVRLEVLPNLKKLSLGYNAGIKSAGLELLWERMRILGAIQLDVGGNRIDDAGVRAWPVNLDCPLPNFAGNPLGDAGALALARRPTLRIGLRQRLCLNACSLGPVGLTELLKAPWFESVRTLDLGKNGLGNAGAAQLAQAQRGKALRNLILAYAGIGDSGAWALARSPLMGQLRRLDVTGNSITQSGIDVLWKYRRNFQVELLTEHNLGYG